jgi:hypothetical protein
MRMAATPTAAAVPAEPIIEVDATTQSRLRGSILPADQRALLARIAATVSRLLTGAQVAHCLAGVALDGVAAAGVLPPWGDRIEFVTDAIEKVLTPPNGDLQSEQKTLRDQFAAHGLQAAVYSEQENSGKRGIRLGLAEFAAYCVVTEGIVGETTMQSVLDAEAARMLEKNAAEICLPLPIDMRVRACAAAKLSASGNWPAYVFLPAVGEVERRLAQQEADTVDRLTRIFGKTSAAIEMAIRAAEQAEQQQP